MAVTPKKLFSGANLTVSTDATSVYTVPANTTAILKNIVIVNCNSAEQTITLYTGVPAMFLNYKVAPKDTVFIDLNHVLNVGERVSYKVSSVDFNLFISGVEVTS